jgi:hypothetical protein
MSTQVKSAGASDADVQLAARDDEIFQRVADEVVGDTEIQAGLGGREKDLEKILAGSRKGLTGMVTAEQKRWMSAEGRAAQPRVTVDDDGTEEKGWVYRVLFVPVMVVLGLSALSAIVCLFVGYAVASKSTDPVFGAWRDAGLVSLAVAAGAFVIAIVLGQVNLSVVAKKQAPVYRAAADQAEKQYADVLKNFLLGQARDWTNSHPPKSSQPFLLVFKSAAGLAEVYSPDYLVSNQASKELANLITQLSGGGTIGLAGPRGAGKTKLIREHCPMGEKDEEFYVDRSTGFIALMVPAPVEYQPADFIAYLLGKLAEAYLEYHGKDIAGRNIPLWRRLILRAPLLRSKRSREGRDDGPAVAAAPKNYQLIADAENYREKVRVQRSSTRTVGAGLATPGNIASASGQSATTLTGLAWSYPDLIGAFRTFLRKVAFELHDLGPVPEAGDAGDAGKMRRGVIIGIDELDKVSDGEQAQRFVNELKAVLGVPYCHFLISISDDAQAAFEMRGLPVRDAFDSAFDEIIQVRYLRLSDSQKLLSMRVTGMSEPFLRLCHCLAGGLPRDLIRVARRLIMGADELDKAQQETRQRAARQAGQDPAAEDPAVQDPAVQDPAVQDPAVQDPAVEEPAPEPVRLDTVCQQMVLQELRRKLNAAEVSSWRQAGRLGSGLLHQVQQLVAFVPDGDKLPPLCDMTTGSGLQTGLAAVMAGLTSPPPADPAPGQAPGPQQQVPKLRPAAGPRTGPGDGQKVPSVPELAVYLLYLLTLLEVFVWSPESADGIMVDKHGKPASEEWFDQLSGARQMLGADPRWAWLTIESCRQQWGLQPAYPYPDHAANHG